MNKKILVAVAWPYANGPRHVGHVAGFGVPSDIFARYHRLAGNDVLMVSGTDDHGTPSMVQADKEGVTPKQLVDRYNAVIGEDLRNLGLSYDLFTRTLTQNHYRVTQDLFTQMLKTGAIYKDTMTGTFSSATGKALPDRYVEGTCPICGYGEARGDQCDNCGNQLDPADLINPRSKIDGSPPEFRPTEHFFLDLPKFKERLAEWIGSQTHWRPNVRAFSLNLLKEVPPRAITRDLDWGVPIPLPGYDDKRIYVWFDAVIGYLSASIEWAHNRGTPDAWQEWWLDPEARGYYFMGKDNIVFHSEIWPAMLMGYDTGPLTDGKGTLNLPYDVVSSEFLTMEGKKFSSSRGVVIYVGDVLSRYDADALRYYLTIGGPETQDTDFTWAEFVRRNNDELVATWGNLVNRVIKNAYNNFDVVPEPGELTEADQQILRTVEGGFGTVGQLLEGARFRAALQEAMNLAAQANGYISEQEPWKVIKLDRQRAGTILYVGLRVVDNLKTLLCPFLPFSAQRLHEMLGYEGTIAGPLTLKQVEEAGASHQILTCEPETWVGRWQPSELPIGQEIKEPAPLFRKLDPKIVDEELARLEAK
ncbi:MAG: methionine--tRNA ligase [Chloroflexota bacterium]|nr:methionine--tRNA ligase [Chloroflexota bacterium]PLS80081.1 MAG: methionine--tRNA ligase [Chloroflexota bacterium]